jgi:sodium-dependent dicarboxylate transporter 2/3/5
MLFANIKGYLFLLVAPIIGIPILFLPVSDFPKAPRAAYACFIMAFFWITEALPLSVTALLPLILFPTLQVATANEVASAYFNDTIILMFGSFVMAMALEKYNLHQKVALKLLQYIGARPKMLMLGFMLISFFISMWISNTATTSLMAPLALAVLSQLRDKNTGSHAVEDEEINTPVSVSDSVELESSHYAEGIDSKKQREIEHEVLVADNSDDKEANYEINPEILEELDHFAKGIMLSVAYSSSIGGTATLIGTGSNLILTQQLKILHPTAPEISFGKWFLFATPAAMIFAAFTWGFLCFLYARKTKFKISRASLQRQYEQLGPLTFPQIVVLIDFGVMILLWFTRSLWATSLFGSSKMVTDGTISIFAAIVLFCIPSAPRRVTGAEKINLANKENFKDRILDEEDIKRVSWDIVLLLAGGMALALGFSKSGLSNLIGKHLNVLSTMPLFLLVALVSVFVLFTTELTSNIATATVVLPILSAMAVSIGQNPLLLMIPATICSSYAFMLPVSTPPNAIVFASNLLKVSTMAKTGLLLNILGALFIPAIVVLLGGPVFGIVIDEVPDWAKPTS